MSRKRTAKVNSRRLGVIVPLAVLVLLFLAGLLMLHAWEESTDTAPDGGVEAPAPGEALTFYNGAWYRPRKGLETVLGIGVDQAAADSTLHRDKKYEQSDFLLLLILDRKNECCTAIHINRDTMAEIRVLDDDTNEFLGTITGQLSLAHAYGNRPEACCRNTVDAVEGLLYGIEIDHYLSLTMDGIVLLNDLVGGVTVEVMDDLTVMDSALVQGETVTLKGRQALTYVQARKGLEDPTNLHRMERQRQYLEALQDQLLARVGESEDFAMSTLLELNNYMVSGCSIQKLSDISEQLGEFGVAEYRSLKGEDVVGEEHMEYYVDQDALRELVMELFYEPVSSE